MAAVKVRVEGFTVLSEGGDAPIAESVSPSHLPERELTVCSLVFVHGLQGHPEKTWSYKDEESDAKPAKHRNLVSRLLSRKKPAPDVEQASNSSAVTSSTRFWPTDPLAKDCPDARIMTYGYDSHVARFFKGPANQNGIVAHGIALMRALEVERRGCRERPIVFLVHSLGGLILKQVRIWTSIHRSEPWLSS
jgi:hypothetical protein